MRALKLDLMEFIEMLKQKPPIGCAILVMDVSPPSSPTLPLVGDNFLWKIKDRCIPNRKEAEILFSEYGIIPEDKWIIIFTNSKLRKFFYFDKKEKMIVYKYTNWPETILNKAFKYKDSNFISWMVRKLNPGKIILRKKSFTEVELEKLMNDHWILKECIDKIKLEKGYDLEDVLLYGIASEIIDFSKVKQIDGQFIPPLFRDIIIKGGKLEKEYLKMKMEIKMMEMDYEKRSKFIVEENEGLTEGEIKTYLSLIFYYDKPNFIKVIPTRNKKISIVHINFKEEDKYGDFEYDKIVLVYRDDKDHDIKAKILLSSYYMKGCIFFIENVEEGDSGIIVKVKIINKRNGTNWNEEIKINRNDKLEASEKPFSKILRDSIGKISIKY